MNEHYFPGEDRQALRILRVASWIGYALVCFGILMLLALLGVARQAFGAEGDRVLRTPGAGDYIVISLAKCSSRMVNERTKPEYRAQNKQATYHHRNGTKIAGCWLTVPQHPGMIFTAWEDGDVFQFSDGDFVPMGMPPGYRPGYRPDDKSWTASVMGSG